MRCVICGSNTSSDIKINDPKYNVAFKHEAQVCKQCFDLWAADNKQELLIRIGEKIRRKL